MKHPMKWNLANLNTFVSSPAVPQLTMQQLQCKLILPLLSHSFLSLQLHFPPQPPFLSPLLLPCDPV